MRRSTYSGLEWADAQVLRTVTLARKHLPLTLFPKYKDVCVLGRHIDKTTAAEIAGHLAAVTCKSPDCDALKAIGEDMLAFHDDLIAQIYRLEFN